MSTVNIASSNAQSVNFEEITASVNALNFDQRQVLFEIALSLLAKAKTAVASSNVPFDLATLMNLASKSVADVTALVDFGKEISDAVKSGDLISILKIPDPATVVGAGSSVTLDTQNLSLSAQSGASGLVNTGTRSVAASGLTGFTFAPLAVDTDRLKADGSYTPSFPEVGDALAVLRLISPINTSVQLAEKIVADIKAGEDAYRQAEGFAIGINRPPALSDLLTPLIDILILIVQAIQFGGVENP